MVKRYTQQIVGLGLLGLSSLLLPVSGLAYPKSQALLSQTQSQADIYLQKGHEALGGHNYQEAITNFNLVIKAGHPKLYQAYYGRGSARFNLKDYQGAMADFDRAIQINPNYALAYYGRGRVRYSLGDYKGAVAELDQTIRLDPLLTLPYNLRGLSRYKLKDYQGAIADFDQNLRMDPKDIITARNRERIINELREQGIRIPSPPPALNPAANAPAPANTAPIDVYRIARQSTVLIDGQAPGSGVIISRVGNNYYVLTAKHVVETADEYAIVTSNGKRFNLNYRLVKQFNNLDLAVVQFTSGESFPIARLGNSSQLNQGDTIFVSGWSAQGFAQPTHQITDGRLTGLARGESGGYELAYNNATGRGMSGGPVFDRNGRVVGIHGRAVGNDGVGKIGINLGIPINLFLTQAPQAGLNLQQLGLASLR